MFEAVALIIVGVLLIVSGVFNMKGNLKIIHSYHYKKVKEEDFDLLFYKARFPRKDIKASMEKNPEDIEKIRNKCPICG